MKYNTNENTLNAIKDISNLEETWDITYTGFKGIFPETAFHRVTTRENMKLKWIIDMLCEADKWDFIQEFDHIDISSRTIFLKTYCMASTEE